MNSRQRQAIYFALAVIGLIGCWYFNLQWTNSDTLPQGGKGFVELMFANSASSSIGWDLIFGSLPMFMFIIIEGRRLGMKRPWLYVIAGFITAFAFVCPLFFAMRERHMERSAARSLSVS
jgi:Terpene cyclase DEP1